MTAIRAEAVSKAYIVRRECSRARRASAVFAAAMFVLGFAAFRRAKDSF